MAGDLKGAFEFPGLKSILSGTFTLGHGISPSVAVVEVTPEGTLSVPSGTLTIRYGTTVLTFPDCCVDMANLAAGRNGRTWSIRIKDRRWRWVYGSISGVYNQRTPDGEFDTFPELEAKELTAAILKAKGDKTPQELAKLLLDAMGEKNYDVSQLPNKTRPAVSWDNDNPAEQLARLCDSLGCHVVLGTNNRVSLCLLGSGQSLPTNLITNGGYGFDPPEMPDSLKFIGGPTVYQLRFILEPVGLDLDGIVKPIKDLSYNPHGVGEKYGWSTQDPNTLPKLIGDDTLTMRTHALALSCVWRWYRIKEVATLDNKVPHFGEIETIKQLLPLSDTLLDTQDFDLKVGPTIGSELPQPASASVTGQFYWTTEPRTFVNSPQGTKYPGSFSMDHERGIVMFSDPMFLDVMLEQDLVSDARVVLSKSGSFAPLPARLVLECTCNVRDPIKRTPERYSIERKLTNGRFGTGAKSVKRDDERLEVRARYKSQATTAYNITNTTNLATATAPTTAETLIDTVTNELGTGMNAASHGLKDRANYYLDVEQAMYQPKESLNYSYIGIMDLTPDGRIHQITWKVGRGGVTTEASENSEFELKMPTYTERRQAEIAREERASLTRGDK